MSFENEEIVIDGLDDIEIENTSIDEIDRENINLLFLGVDKSGSMDLYVQDMRSCLKNFKDALSDSKESDEILIARADFNAQVTIGGYKRIGELNTDFSACGGTAIYDTIVEGSKKLIEYRDFLKNEGMRVKCVFAIFSDGDDTVSHESLHDAKKEVDKMNQEEITTAFISFGSAALNEAKKLGFRNILDVKSSATELRKAFDCLSKSVIESSKSVVADQDDFFTM